MAVLRNIKVKAAAYIGLHAYIIIYTRQNAAEALGHTAQPVRLLHLEGAAKLEKVASGLDGLVENIDNPAFDLGFQLCAQLLRLAVLPQLGKSRVGVD